MAVVSTEGGTVHHALPHAMAANVAQRCAPQQYLAGIFETLSHLVSSAPS